MEHDEHKVDFAAPGTLQYKLADRTLLPLTGIAIENVDSPPDSSQRELMPVASEFGGFCFLGEGCMRCSASRYQHIAFSRQCSFGTNRSHSDRQTEATVEQCLLVMAGGASFIVSDCTH